MQSIIARRPAGRIRAGAASLLMLLLFAVLALTGGLAGSLASPSAHAAAPIVGNCAIDPTWPAPQPATEAQVVALVNAHRATVPLPPLVVQSALTAAAQWKSSHMAQYFSSPTSYNNVLNHDDPAPPIARLLIDRFDTCGFPASTPGVFHGENIAWGYPTAAEVVVAWLASPGHRANIENPNFNSTGAGAAQRADGTWFWTQTFGNASALAVRLRTFTAVGAKPGAIIRWRTASEVGTLGFHVYRSRAGARVRVNRTLIAAKGAAGASYVVRDSRASVRRAPVRYWLQEVALDGTRSLHGPVVLRRPAR